MGTVKHHASRSQIRPRADSEAVICDFCLRMARDVIERADEVERALLLHGTASELCTFCGRRGDEVGGLIAYAPAFICPGCIRLAVTAAAPVRGRR